MGFNLNIASDYTFLCFMSQKSKGVAAYRAWEAVRVVRFTLAVARVVYISIMFLDEVSSGNRALCYWCWRACPVQHREGGGLCLTSTKFP